MQILNDHGYIPIYLIENNIAARAIALDINKGPLERPECILWATG